MLHMILGTELMSHRTFDFLEPLESPVIHVNFVLLSLLRLH